jgi:hypothetical protein
VILQGVIARRRLAGASGVEIRRLCDGRDALKFSASTTGVKSARELKAYEVILQDGLKALDLDELFLEDEEREVVLDAREELEERLLALREKIEEWKEREHDDCPAHATGS